MADFLLELLSEEIPARMQAKARNDLARLFAECASEAGLQTGPADVYSTPRRLALIAREVAGQTEESREEIKGPRAGAPPQALEGFLKKTGLRREQLEERDGVLFAVVERPGRPAGEILADTIRRIVADFPWPKSMRWGDGTLRWVRPLHGIVAILGEDIVPVEIDGIASGAATVGHRFHHSGPITIGGASDYVEKLRACHVIVDQAEREQLIREDAAKAASQAGLTLLPDEGLVVENAGLTEWPVPLLGRFDADFLDVPREVIVLTMRTNQKYFACTNDQGLLAPAFVCVANIDASDGGEAIAQGNARVLAARLADARFFWEQDLKVPLDEQAKKLGGIVFHEKLGTVADKVERVAKLARWLVESGVVNANPDQVERAARLAKADLVTGMVGEFPELQGVIGGYLAEAQGEPKAVVDAVGDHYKPAGQGDEVPTAPVSVAVALADRLDTISSFFAIGEKPTGSKDPFALRRAALGVIRIILVNDLRISLVDALREARWVLVQSLDQHKAIVHFPDDVNFSEPMPVLPSTELYRAGGLLAVLDWETEPESFVHVGEVSYPGFSRDYLEDEGVDYYKVDALSDVVGTGLLYFTDRIEEAQRALGVRHDLIRAVVPKEFLTVDLQRLFSEEPPRTRGKGVQRFRKYNWRASDDPVEILARVRALQEFVETEDGTNLLTAYKRAANILKKEKWGNARHPGLEPGPALSSPSKKERRVPDQVRHDELPQEKALIAALDKAEPNASTAVDKEDFTGAMAALATLRKPIDQFFDHVTVNDPDKAKRERRLNLLMRFRDAVNRVADFSRIEG